MKHLLLGLLLFFSVAAKSQCDTMTSATFSSITQNSVFVSFTVSGSNWTTFNVTLYDSITSAVAFNNPTIYTTTFTATGLTPGRTYKLRTFTIAGMATCEPIVLSPRFRTLGATVGYQPMAANGYLFKRIAVDSTFHIPFKDTSLNSGLTRPGALVVRPADSSFWAWNGSRWNLLSSSSSGLLPLINSKVDSVKYSGDTLYYYANGVAYGRVTNLSGKADTARLILDSTVLRNLINSNTAIIATNTTNIAFNTANLASLNADTLTLIPRFALKLNISDTAAMLNGRLSSITLNNTGILHTTPLTFVRAGGAWTGTQTLANQTAYKVFGTGATTATPTFRGIDSNHFNGAFQTQVRAAQLPAFATSGVQSFSATASQTIFSVTNLPTVLSQITVTRNGITINPTRDYTATSGTLTIITSTIGLLAAGDNILVKWFN